MLSTIRTHLDQPKPLSLARGEAKFGQSCIVCAINTVGDLRAIRSRFSRWWGYCHLSG